MDIIPYDPNTRQQYRSFLRALGISALRYIERLSPGAREELFLRALETAQATGQTLVRVSRDIVNQARNSGISFHTANSGTGRGSRVSSIVPETEIDMADEPMAEVTGNAVNPQYVSRVRHTRSSYGRRRKRTLKYLAYMQEKDYIPVKSFFQTFRNNGFQQGLGSLRMEPIATQDGPTGISDVYKRFPMFCFDLTSFPEAHYTGTRFALSTPTTPDTQYHSTLCRPIRGYQLQCQPGIGLALKNEMRNFKWVPIHKADNATNSTNDFASQITELKGEFNKDHQYISGFRHDYAKIQATFYPGTSLPCKWHVALVQFPTRSGMNTAPPMEYYDGTDYYYTYSTSMMTDADTVNNAMDNCWRKFFSGKLVHPNLKDDVIGYENKNQAGPTYPFKILRHETFDQPARDNPSFGGSENESGLRILKDMFVRMDKWYRGYVFTKEYAETQEKEYSTTASAYNHYTAQSTARRDVSPFGDPSKQVFLCVWCTHYKTSEVSAAASDTQYDQTTVTETPNASQYPSFDIRVEMKHTLATDNLMRQPLDPSTDPPPNPP